MTDPANHSDLVPCGDRWKPCTTFRVHALISYKYLPPIIGVRVNNARFLAFVSEWNFCYRIPPRLQCLRLNSSHTHWPAHSFQKFNSNSSPRVAMCSKGSPVRRPKSNVSGTPLVPNWVSTLLFSVTLHWTARYIEHGINTSEDIPTSSL